MPVPGLHAILPRGILPPSMFLIKVRQRFDSTQITDIEARVRAEIQRFSARIQPGASIALAVGSRGIYGIRDIVRAAVSWLKEKGALPFIIPAMGSHGGATPQGQREILASYGIDEERTGAKVRSSMATVALDSSGLPVRIFMDALAWKSDGVILVNRIKCHTDFRGRYESGLVKMCVVGLGKHEQAREIHGFGVRGLRELIPLCAEKILASGKIIGGLAVVENAYDRPAVIAAIPADRIALDEPDLLLKARSLMPSLPVEDLDLLVVDFIGKDVSGTGMDPNIIGRLAIRGEPEPDSPRIKTIIARDVTPASHGNALGVGFADVTTERLTSKIDRRPMYENVLTSTFLERAKVPVIAEDDRRAIDFCLRACGPIPDGRERIARIRDTLHLAELYVSPAVGEELAECAGVQVTETRIPLVEDDGWCPDKGVWDP
jgi:hypothetical protein